MYSKNMKEKYKSPFFHYEVQKQKKSIATISGYVNILFNGSKVENSAGKLGKIKRAI